MSLNAFAIMLKPVLAKYLEPLEENGTIAKLQRDVTLIAESNAIPELATLVSELQLHNQLMRRLFQLIDQAERQADERTEPARDFEPGPDTGTAGLIRDDPNRLSELSGTD